MKQKLKLLAVLVLVCAAGRTVMSETTVPVDSAGRERLSMDFGWRFSLGHVSELARDFDYLGGDPYGNAKTGDLAGPPHPKFDDSTWEAVDVPHDWAVAVGLSLGASAAA